MKIVVVGGTGMIGSILVRLLSQAGHESVAAARSTGVDAVTGDGLGQVLDGADAVVDASSPGYRDASEMHRFFETAGINLLEAESRAGIAHHVTLSAVGTGKVNGGYFLAKAAQERLVTASGLPFTIVRSTPVFEYIYNIVDAGGQGDTIRLPPILVQPIAAADVARALMHAVLARPANRVVEIAGPITYELPALAEEVLTAFEDSRTIVPDDAAPYFGARVDREPLVGGDHPRFAPTSFEDWLRRALVPA